MRYLLGVAIVLVAGCAVSPEERTRRETAGRIAFTENWQRENSPEGQAAAGCRAKTQFAMAGHVQRSFLDLEGTAKANQMHAACMQYWRQTGRLP